jgi:plasmid stabilization system protein ParE
MKYAVSVLKRAGDDADRIYEWIAAKSPQGAIRWLQALEDALAQLESTADQWGVAPESEDLGIVIRQKLFKTRRGRIYRLLYSIDGNQVRVLRVRGPGQGPLGVQDIQE